MPAIRGLDIELSVNMAAFERGLTKATLATKQFGKDVERSFRDTANSIGVITATFGLFGAEGAAVSQVILRMGEAVGWTTAKFASINKTFGVFAGLAAGSVAGVFSATGALVGLTVEVEKSTDAMFHQAEIAGTSFENFQRLAAGAKMYEVNSEALSMAMARMSNAALKAAESANYGATPFGRLNMSVTDMNKHMKDSGTIFSEAMTILSGMTDITKRNALAQEILGGRMASRLIPAIAAGAAAFKEYGDIAQKVGAVQTTEAGEAAHRFSTELEKIDLVAQGAKNSLTEGLVEPLTRVMEAFINASHEGRLLREVSQEVGTALSWGIAAALEAYKALYDVIAGVYYIELQREKIKLQNQGAGLGFDKQKDAELIELNKEIPELGQQIKDTNQDIHRVVSNITQGPNQTGALVPLPHHAPDSGVQSRAGSTRSGDDEIVDKFIDKQQQSVREQMALAAAVGQTEDAYIQLRAEAEATKAIDEKDAEIVFRIRSLTEQKESLGNDPAEDSRADKLEKEIGTLEAQRAKLKKNKDAITATFISEADLKSMTAINNELAKTSRLLDEQIKDQQDVNAAFLAGEDTRLSSRVSDKLRKEREDVKLLQAEYERLKTVPGASTPVTVNGITTSPLATAKNAAETGAAKLAANEKKEPTLLVFEDINKANDSLKTENELTQRQINSELVLADAYHQGGAAIVSASIAQELDKESQKLDDLQGELSQLGARTDENAKQFDDLTVAIKASNEQLSTRAGLLEREKALHEITAVADETRKSKATAAALEVTSAAAFSAPSAQRQATGEGALQSFKIDKPEVVKTAEMTDAQIGTAPLEKQAGLQKERLAAQEALNEVQANAVDAWDKENAKAVQGLAVQHDLNGEYERQITLLTEAQNLLSRQVENGNISQRDAAEANLELVQAQIDAEQKHQAALDQTAIHIGSLGDATKAFANEIASEGQNAQEKFFGELKTGFDGLESSLSKFIITGQGGFLQVVRSMEEALIKLLIQFSLLKIAQAAGIVSPGTGGTASPLASILGLGSAQGNAAPNIFAETTKQNPVTKLFEGMFGAKQPAARNAGGSLGQPGGSAQTEDAGEFGSLPVNSAMGVLTQIPGQGLGGSAGPGQLAKTVAGAVGGGSGAKDTAAIAANTAALAAHTSATTVQGAATTLSSTANTVATTGDTAATASQTAATGLHIGAITINTSAIFGHIAALFLHMGTMLLHLGATIALIAATIANTAALVWNAIVNTFKAIFPFLAEGGDTKSGGMYVVGEKGPELFSPGAGHVYSNAALQSIAHAGVPGTKYLAGEAQKSAPVHSVGDVARGSNSQPGATTAPGHTVNVNHNISMIDATGFDELLNKHSKVVANHVDTALRKSNQRIA